MDICLIYSQIVTGMKKLHLLMLVACLLLAIQSAHAYVFAELESTYLGDGWFKYRLKSMNDLFFREADLLGLWVSCTNRIDFGPNPPHWPTNSYPQPNGAEWDIDDPFSPQTRPYEVTFFVRSSETHFKTQFAAAGLVVSLYPADWFPLPGVGVNVLGVFTLTNLVACAAEEADNSPTNFLARVSIISDATIDGLVRSEDGHLTGVNFSWDRTGILTLQATRDFHTWTNISDMDGFPGQNSWYVPWQLPYLEHYGDYFRLQFGPQSSSTPAQGSPEIIPSSSTSTSSSPQTVEARVVRCQPLKPCNSPRTVCPIQP